MLVAPAGSSKNAQTLLAAFYSASLTIFSCSSSSLAESPPRTRRARKHFCIMCGMWTTTSSPRPVRKSHTPPQSLSWHHRMHPGALLNIWLPSNAYVSFDFFHLPNSCILWLLDWAHGRRSECESRHQGRANYFSAIRWAFGTTTLRALQHFLRYLSWWTSICPRHPTSKRIYLRYCTIRLLYVAS